MSHDCAAVFVRPDDIEVNIPLYVKEQRSLQGAWLASTKISGYIARRTAIYGRVFADRLFVVHARSVSEAGEIVGYLQEWMLSAL